MAYVHFARLDPIPAFPFDIVDSVDVGPGTRYPVKFSLFQLFKLYWRWKNGQYTITYNNGSDPLVYSPRVSSDGGLTVAVSETDLVCPKWSISSGGVINIFDSYGGSPDKCRYSDGGYWPAVSIIGIEDDSPFRVIYSSYASVLNGKAADFEIMGVDIPLYYGEPGGLGYTMSCDTDFEKYWPYDPGDGEGAMYDEDTGELLFGRDPFSVQY